MTPQSDKFYLMALCTLKAKGITRLKCLDTLLSATYTKCCSPVFKSIQAEKDCKKTDQSQFNFNKNVNSRIPFENPAVWLNNFEREILSNKS